MTDLVLIHGAGTGGWLWDDVAVRLRAQGHRAYAPDLRGVGSHQPEDCADVDLSAHIDQMVRLIEAEDLDHIVLVGFSYAGFVISGVADRLPDRVDSLVFVDAFVPRSGHTFFDLLPDRARTMMQLSADRAGGGRAIPPAPLEMLGGIGALEPGVDREHVRKVLERRGFHPIGTYTEPYPGREEGPTTPGMFISCTDKPAGDPLLSLATHVRGLGWQVEQIPTGHFAMLSMPTALTRLISAQIPAGR